MCLALSGRGKQRWKQSLGPTPKELEVLLDVQLQTLLLPLHYSGWTLKDESDLSTWGWKEGRALWIWSHTSKAWDIGKCRARMTTESILFQFQVRDSSGPAHINLGQNTLSTYYALLQGLYIQHFVSSQ